METYPRRIQGGQVTWSYASDATSLFLCVRTKAAIIGINHIAQNALTAWMASKWISRIPKKKWSKRSVSK